MASYIVASFLVLLSSSVSGSSQKGQCMSKLAIVIDDSMTVRKILEVALRREELEVLTYADGVEALRALKAQPQLVPAVIIIDICMPRMDGYTVLRLIRASSRFDSTFVVMLSRRDGVMDRLKGRLAGATVYMTKPFKVREILSIILPHVYTVSSAASAPADTSSERNTGAIHRIETGKRPSLLDFATTSNVTLLQKTRHMPVEHLA
jgi:twitching motility two-component system response regulator PilG